MDVEKNEGTEILSCRPFHDGRACPRAYIVSSNEEEGGAREWSEGPSYLGGFPSFILCTKIHDLVKK